MTRADAIDEIEVASADALWHWLAEHHSQTESVWCVTWKKATPEKYISREEVLDALVAYGWVDGIRRKRDDGRTMQLISPRQQQAWAASYKARAERLETEGRMQAPGRAAVERGKGSGLWTFSDDIDRLAVPDDLEAALDAITGARDLWERMAPSYRRNVLRWLKSAKHPETRSKRIADLAARTGRREKVPHY